MNPLNQIADPKIKQEALVEAIQQLGPVTEEPGFWSAIANDDNYSQDHRRRAVYELIQRHVYSGMTLADMAEILDDPTWLKDEDVTMVTIVGGKLPVKWSMEDTIFILHIFPGLPDRQYANWAAYIKISGKVERQSIVDVLRGRPVEQAATGATVLEVGLVPDNPAPDAD
jgi:hypothetical protein